MFRAETERGPQRAPQGFKPRYAVVQPESPSPHRRWAVPGARGRACACRGSPRTLSIRELCPFRITFPASADYLKQVIEPERARLLQGDLWYDKAVAWSREFTRTTHPAPPVAPTARDLESACGASAYRCFFSTFSDVQWPSAVLELIDWLALKLIEGRLVYDIGTTDVLLRDNPTLFRSLRVTYEFLTKTLRLTPNMVRSHPVLSALEAIADAVGTLPGN